MSNAIGLKKIGRLTAASMLFGLSCAIWNAEPTATRPGPSVASHGEMLGPSAVQLIHGRFLRYQSGLAPFEIERTAEAIVAESERWNLDRKLVLAVIHIESRYHTFAISRVGALGLMQIMPQTGAMLAQEMGLDFAPEMLFEPVTNVRMGTRYLAYLYDRYGKWDRALAAYNMGPLRVDSRLKTGAALAPEYVRLVHVQLDSPRFIP